MTRGCVHACKHTHTQQIEWKEKACENCTQGIGLKNQSIWVKPIIFNDQRKGLKRSIMIYKNIKHDNNTIVVYDINEASQELW